MNFKPLFFGAVFGFLVAIFPSCGGAPCGPTNCDGCCVSINKCVPNSASNSNTACGKGGANCANCATQNQVCRADSFVCEIGATDGGTGGGSAGGGTGGGTGGGATDGGSGPSCSVPMQNCATGSSCLFAGDQGTGECFPGPCDIVTQNCPTATDKCTYAPIPDGGSGRVCAPAGPQMEGQECDPQSDNCAKGLSCANEKCVRFCYSQSNCVASGSECIGLIRIANTREAPSTCFTPPSCDLLLQNCGASEGCYVTTAGSLCGPAGSVPPAGSCGQTEGNCTPGNLCVATSPDGRSAVCKGVCNLDGGLPNCGGGPCDPLLGEPYGACP